MSKGELYIIFRLENIDHLTEEIIKVNNFMVQIIHPLNLLFIERVHFPSSDDSIIVQINNFKPIIDADISSLVLLGQHESHEIPVVHMVLLVAVEPPWNLLEYPVHTVPVQRVAVIPAKLLLGQVEVMVRV